ncbi:MAG: tyrosine-type recombinase/integrase [Actinobacteria bacterium]|nr:tyrosine-type recombinase/integrase [Actinomycetota bacterium]
MAGDRGPVVIALEDRLAGYLAVRRALGYRLARAEKLLAQFIAWLNERDETTITAASALAWATLPAATDSNWHAHRLTVVRGFAAHVHALDPAHELVAQDLLPQRPRRAVPYLYSDAEIRALMEASSVIPTPHRAATMRALIGLLAVTGMRIGEAIRLDRGDIDHQHDVLTVVESKFGKSRQLAVHATTTAALRAYLRGGDRPIPIEPTDAVFTSAVGTRLTYCNVHLAFKRIVAHAGLVPRSTACRPRPHDLRHAFAVNTLLDAYRHDRGDGEHIQTRIALLCTYLGHVNPGSTYWYLQAAPELLALAAERLDRVEAGAR